MKRRKKGADIEMKENCSCMPTRFICAFVTYRPFFFVNTLYIIMIRICNYVTALHILHAAYYAGVCVTAPLMNILQISFVFFATFSLFFAFFRPQARFFLLNCLYIRMHCTIRRSFFPTVFQHSVIQLSSYPFGAIYLRFVPRKFLRSSLSIVANEGASSCVRDGCNSRRLYPREFIIRPSVARIFSPFLAKVLNLQHYVFLFSPFWHSLSAFQTFMCIA